MMSSGSHGRRDRFRRLTFAAALAVSALVLTGCAASSASPAQTPSPTVPTASVAATPTPTATPTALTADTPIDALAAWAMCKGLGDDGGQSLHQMTRLYEPGNIVAADGGFTVQLIGDVGARSATDSWCEVSGTFGDPQATFHLLLAEPVDVSPSAPFTAVAPAAGERTEGTPIDALTAWAMCKGFERGMPLDLEGQTGTATNDYDPRFVVDTDGTFTVYILGSAASTEQTATCTISGPLGDPTAEYLLPR
ncbi:hypothetical protein BJQ94_17730 [Cryobacterium sp. SO2]|uniref:hypothetical protein n=1 Tax=Cryobacterium sp. SO2 TaxID=1897060 RepID=UPI00223D9D57|nr:hypothetical protein [Cryobacterium sp. SO2]WEO77170.1 hypothetical protein BJQ94_17730 [Cryobacterium sp. SO2]